MEIPETAKARVRAACEALHADNPGKEGWFLIDSRGSSVAVFEPGKDRGALVCSLYIGGEKDGWTLVYTATSGWGPGVDRSEYEELKTKD